MIFSHPHPDHPCACEWENTWRLVYAPPGATPTTVVRHPAAQAGATAIPSPDESPVPTAWAT
ncbi:hypothetical protein ACFWUW_15875 [Streptomyces sp. NPDC058655]|uniref:hypothetical protein n=1 Tax=Streptomyces sp. NPDC058655 TaxID=3346577 RepID=UPI00364D8658